MKPFKSALFVVLLIGLFNVTKAQEIMSTVKVQMPKGKEEIAKLLGLLHIDHYYMEDGAIISEISQKEVARLKASQYKFEILVPNVGEHVKALNRDYDERVARGEKPTSRASRMAFDQTGKTVGNIIQTPAAFELKSTFGGYYSYAEMQAAMTQLVASYPAIAQQYSIGNSVDGLPIWGVKISDNVATDDNEPEVLYLGIQHAREAIGGSSMIYFMQYLCEQYYNPANTQLRDLINNREVFIIPCVNPDGWEWNRTHGGVGAGWRKNRKLNSDGSYGVDLNRNYGVDWGNCPGTLSDPNNACGTNVKNEDTYIGTGAFSEPETQAVRDFTYRHRFSAMIDQHAFGPYYSLPFGRPSLHTMPALDQKFYTIIPAAMGTYNGMRAGNSPESVNYEVAGGVKDWMLMGNIGSSIAGGLKGRCYGMTGEGGAGGGVGGSYSNFWAPKLEIEGLCKGMTFQNLQLLLGAGPYVKIQDMSNMVVSTKTSVPMTFQINRIGLADAPVDISIVPIQNVTAGSPVTVNSLPNYYDSYSGSINVNLPSNMPNGQRFRFAWKVTCGGFTFYDTVTKFYHATPSSMILMSDDMETGAATSRWTVTSWAYSTDGAFGGTRSLTESPGGNYPGNVGATARMARYTNVIDLTGATASYITFWTKHRLENFRDKVQLQVSSNSTGTNGTWTPIVGSTTVQEPGTLDGSTMGGLPALTGIREDWVRVYYDISAYNGQSNVRFRFAFTSDDANSSPFDFRQDDGIYIDNIQLIRSTTAIATLPVHFLSFTGKLLQDQTVRLDWDAQTDQMHDYFEVEKSANGTNYVSIGRGPATAPYWKIDPTPYIGNNYYRIKQVDKDGTITYSPVVNIVYSPKKFDVVIYPNPVTDFLKVKINAATSELYTIRIADLSGRIVHEEKLTTSATVREVSINLKQQAAQMYIITVKNSKNEIVATEKLAKH